MNSHASTTKGEQFKFLRPWLGQGLIISEGDHWKSHRKLLNPAFNVQLFTSFVPIMNDNIAIMMKRIEKAVKIEMERSTAAAAAELDIRPLMKDLSLDIVCETSLSASVGAQLSTTDRKEYIEPVKRATILFAKRLMNPFVHNDLIYSLTPDGRENAAVIKQIHGFVKKLATQRKATIEAERGKSLNCKPELNRKESTEDEEDFGGTKKRKYAFFDSLLQAHWDNPKDFTEKDILEEVNALMFAGQDSTSITLTMALLLIAEDRRVQAKIVAELEEVFSGEDDPLNCAITLEHARHMRYLEMVIKEALRLYSSAANTAKKIEKDITVNGHRIPAGTSALILFSILHKDPEVFPQPEKFIPERFNENEKWSNLNSRPYAYIPFSAGPRACPGQRFSVLEMKLVIGSILRRYHLVAVTRREQVKIGISVVLAVRSKVVIRFEDRAAARERESYRGIAGGS